MAGDLDQLALLRALTDDKENAARIAALHEAMREHQAVLDKIIEERQAAERASEDARALRRAAQDKEADLVSREQKLADHEKTLEEVNSTLIAQQNDFAAARQQVDADHKAREERIAGIEAQQAAQRDDLDSRERAIAEREAAAGVQEAMVARRHRAMQDAMAVE